MGCNLEKTHRLPVITEVREDELKSSPDELADKIYNTLTIIVSNDDTGLTDPNLGLKFVKNAISTVYREMNGGKEIDPVSLQSYVDAYTKRVQKGLTVDPVAEQKVFAPDQPIQQDPNSDLGDPIEEFKNVIKTWALTPGDLVNHMEFTSQYYLQLGQKFKREFYNAAIANAYKGEFYSDTSKVLNERIQAFKQELKDKLEANSSYVDTINQTAPEALAKGYKDDSHLKDIYLTSMIDKFLPTLIKIHIGEAIDFNKSTGEYFYKTDTESREGWEDNDGVGVALATIAGLTKLHLIATPVLERVSEGVFREVPGKFLTQNAMKKMISNINTSIMVSGNKDSRTLYTPYIEDIKGAIYNYATANSSKPEGGVAWSIYHKFFSDAPITVHAEGGLRDFHSLTSIANRSELSKKKSINSMLVNFAGNIAQTSKYDLFSFEDGELKLTQGGSATRELLKGNSNNIVDTLNSEDTRKQISGGFLTPKNAFKGTPDLLTIGFVKRGGGSAQVSFEVSKVAPDSTLSTFLKADRLIGDDKSSSEIPALDSNDYSNLLARHGVVLSTETVSRIIKNTDGTLNRTGIQKLNDILVNLVGLNIYNKAVFDKDVTRGTAIRHAMGITNEVRTKLAEWNPASDETKKNFLYPSKIMHYDFDFLADEIDNVSDIYSLSKNTNADGNTVASYGLTMPIHKFTGKVFDIMNTPDSVHSESIFKRGLYKITTWGIKDGLKKATDEKAVSHKSLTYLDNAIFDIYGLFGTHAVNSGFKAAHLNIATFSDGSSVAIPEITKGAGTADFLPVLNGKLDTASLKKDYNNSVGRYYQKVGQSVVNEWKSVVNNIRSKYPSINFDGIENVKTLTDLKKYVETAKIPQEVITNLDGRDGKLVENHDYVVKEITEGKVKSKIIGIRGDFAKIVEIHTPDITGAYPKLDAFMDDQLKRFISNLTSRDTVGLKESETKGANVRFNSKDIGSNLVNEAMATRFGEKWKSGDVVLKNGKDIEYNPLFEGYFWHYNTIANDMMHIMQGNIFQYKAPKSTDVQESSDYTPLNAMMNDSYVDRIKRSKLQTSSYYQPILTRLNAQGTPVDTSESYNNLLGSFSRVAYFSDTKLATNVLSLFKKQDQEVYDGAMFITPMERLLMSNSFGGAYSEFNSSIVKNIQTDRDLRRGLVRFEKKAEYELTPEVMRYSEGNGRFDANKMVEMSMMVQFPPETRINYTSRKGITLDSSKVYNNYLEIYKDLGGLRNPTVFEELVDIRATHHPIATAFVGRIGIMTSVKTGQSNNNGNIVDFLHSGKQLNHIESSNENMGIQLNAYHDPDKVEGGVSLISQALNAVPAEGRTMGETMALYRAIAQLSDHKFANEMAQHKGDNARFAKAILTKYADTNEELATSFVVDKIRSGKYSFDDPQILRILQSQTMSTLEKIAVKHKFNGGQFVITPISDLIMVHEFIDHNGVNRVMMRPQFKEYLNERISEGENVDHIKDTPARNLKYNKYTHSDGTTSTDTPEWKFLETLYNWKSGNGTADDLKLVLEQFNALFPESAMSMAAGMKNVSKEMMKVARTSLYTKLDSPEWTGTPGEVILPMWMKETFKLQPGDQVDTILNDPYFFQDRLQALDSNLSDADAETMEIPLRKGFEESLHGIVARIPGSGKQSDNSFRVIGFMDGYGNSIGVPFESLIIKGEDFDIDKGNVLIKEFANSPNNLNHTGMSYPYKVDSTGNVLSKAQFKQLYPEEFQSYEDSFKGKNAEWYESGVRNFIVDTLYRTGIAPKVALEKGSIVNTDSLGNIVKGEKNEMYFSPSNPLSTIIMAVINQRGKQMVGVEATAEKAYFAIYYSAMKQVMKEGGTIIKNSFKPFEVNIPGGKDGKDGIVFSKIANLSNIDILSQMHPEEVLEVKKALINARKDGAIKRQAWSEYSGLINAATDNAKLLYLGRLNADLDTGNFLNALVAVGCPIERAVAFITQPKMIELQERAKSEGVSLKQVLGDIVYKKTKGYEDIIKVSRMAKEFQFVGKSLSVNTKFPNKGEDVYSYSRKIEDFIKGAKDRSENRTNGSAVKTLRDFNFTTFLNNPTYRDKMIDAYDRIRIIVNPLRVFSDNEHYHSNMKYYQKGKDMISELSSTVALTHLIMDKFDKDKLNDENLFLRARRTAEKYLKILYFRNRPVDVQYDDNDPNAVRTYKFNATKSTNEYGNSLQFLDHFRGFVTKLREKYPENFFVEKLVASNSRDTLTGKDFTVYRTMDTRNTSDEVIMMLKTGLKNIDVKDQKVLFNYSLLMSSFNNVSGSFYDLMDTNLHQDFNDFLSSVSPNRLFKNSQATNTIVSDMGVLSGMISDLSLQEYEEVKSLPKANDYATPDKVKLYNKDTKKSEYYEKGPDYDETGKKTTVYKKVSNTNDLATIMPFTITDKGELQLNYSKTAQNLDDNSDNSHLMDGDEQPRFRRASLVNSPDKKQDIKYGRETLLKKQGVFSVTPDKAVDKKAITKAELSNKYIGFGNEGSSTKLYGDQIYLKHTNTDTGEISSEAASIVNSGKYTKDDVVFLSANGKRNGAKSLKEWNSNITKTKTELNKAMDAGATIVKDSERYLKSNPYNTGEIELSAYLKKNGYVYSEQPYDGQILGVWKSPETKINEQTSEVKLSPLNYEEGMNQANSRIRENNIPQNLQGDTANKWGKTQSVNPEVAASKLGKNAFSIDMIEAGFRTRTTRSGKEIAKYGKIEGEDGEDRYDLKPGTYIHQFGKSVDGTTKSILTRVTAVYDKSDPRFEANWHKEGWSANGFGKLSPGLEYAVEFEVVKPKEVTPEVPKKVTTEDETGRTLSPENAEVNKFIDKNNKLFYSVEHAYQSFKTGTFDNSIYSDPRWAKGEVVINPAPAKTENGFNEFLLKRSKEAVANAKKETINSLPKPVFSSVDKPLKIFTAGHTATGYDVDGKTPIAMPGYGSFVQAPEGRQGVDSGTYESPLAPFNQGFKDTYFADDIVTGTSNFIEKYSEVGVSPENKSLAEKILDNADSTIQSSQVKVVDSPFMRQYNSDHGIQNEWVSKYDPESNTFFVMGNAPTLDIENAFIHELTSTTTQSEFKINEEFKSNIEELASAVEHTPAQTFLSDALTDKKYQESIKETPSPYEGSGKSVWNDFTETVGKMYATVFGHTGNLDSVLSVPDVSTKPVPQTNFDGEETPVEKPIVEHHIEPKSSPIASLLDSIESNEFSEDPISRVSSIDGNGQGVEFSNKTNIVDEFTSGDPKTSKIVAGTQEEANTINEQVRKKMFGNDLDTIHKGEVLTDANGEDFHVTSARKSTKTIISPLKKEIDLSGTTLETKDSSGKSKTIFLADADSLEINAKDLDQAKNYFESLKGIPRVEKELAQNMEAFYSKFSTLGTDYNFGYAVTPDTLKGKYDNLYIHEDSIFSDPDVESRNVRLHKAISGTNGKVTILSSRYFPKEADINKPKYTLVKSVSDASDHVITNRVGQTSTLNSKMLGNFSRLAGDTFGVKVRIITNEDILNGDLPLSLLDKKGFAHDGIIYINSGLNTIDTPMHELSHVWLNAIKPAKPELYSRIVDTWAKTEQGKRIQAEHPEYSPEIVGEEAFAEWVGESSDGTFDMLGNQNAYLNWISEKLSLLSPGATAEMSVAKLAKEMIDGGKLSGYFDNLTSANREDLSDLYGTGYLNEKLQSIKDRMYKSKTLEKKC